MRLWSIKEKQFWTAGNKVVEFLHANLTYVYLITRAVHSKETHLFMYASNFAS